MIHSTQAKAAIVILALLANQACAALNPTHPLTPIGNTAFRAKQVAIAIGAVQDVTINAEKAGIISTDAARTIIETTRLAAIAGSELISSIQASGSATTDRGKAIAVIRQLLTDLPNRLDPAAAQLIRPYCTAVVALLSSMGGL